MPTSGALTNVTLSINATHPWVGDLIFNVAHNAADADIIDRPGVPASPYGCSGDDINAVRDDAAALPVESQCAPSVPAINGTFSLNEPLSVFAGMDRGGTWTITATGAASALSGTLNEWCLTFTPVGGGASPTPTATATMTVSPTATATMVVSPSRRAPRPPIRPRPDGRDALGPRRGFDNLPP